MKRTEKGLALKPVTEKRMRSKKIIKRSTATKIVGLAFVSPWIVGFFWFTFFPILQMIQYSLSNVVFSAKGTRMKYVGLDNFLEVLFVTPDFRVQAPAYLRLMLLLVPMILVFSILLATMLNLKIRFRGFYRAVFFLPVILLNPPMMNNLFQMEAFTLQGLHNFFVFDFIIDMLENAQRMAKGLPGCPKVKMGTSKEYFDKLKQTVGDNKYLPKWVGELYLEFHRGTYTSMAKNKKYNQCHI